MQERFYKFERIRYFKEIEWFGDHGGYVLEMFYANKISKHKKKQ